jgi:hypothetical protein
MSYNIAQSRVASEVRAALPKLVTDAKENAPSDEHEQIELAGQAVSYALEGVHDDDVVELQAYGSNVPSTGNRVFFISVTTRQVRARANESPAETGKPWDPSQGPFVRRSTSTPSSTASSTANPGTVAGNAASVPGAVDPAIAAASPASPGGTTSTTGAARGG